MIGHQSTILLLPLLLYCVLKLRVRYGFGCDATILVFQNGQILVQLLALDILGALKVRKHHCLGVRKLVKGRSGT